GALTVNPDPLAYRNVVTVDGQGVVVRVNDVTARFSPGTVTSITVRGANQLDVDTTAYGVPVTATLATSGTAVMAGASQNLGSIQGTVTVHCAGGGSLDVEDQRNNFSDEITVTRNSVRRWYTANVNYDGVSLLRVYGSRTRSTTYNVASTPAAASTEIYGGDD